LMGFWRLSLLDVSVCIIVGCWKYGRKMTIFGFLYKLLVICRNNL